jgi:hypothetical protein
MSKTDCSSGLASGSGMVWITLSLNIIQRGKAKKNSRLRWENPGPAGARKPAKAPAKPFPVH